MNVWIVILPISRRTMTRRSVVAWPIADIRFGLSVARFVWMNQSSMLTRCKSITTSSIVSSGFARLSEIYFGREHGSCLTDRM